MKCGVVQTIIFDLSEVLIAGLLGIEEPLSMRLKIQEDEVLPAFGGDLFYDLLCGKISEDSYLTQIIKRQGWKISADVLKQVIRQNFHQRVPGMDAIVARLVARYELVLLSDHAAEWVDYIRSIHPFLQEFKAQFFSFELKQTKREASTFHTVLEAIGREPQQCLFIDDSEANVLTSTSVGIPSIRFTTAQQLPQKFVGLGIWA